MSFFRAPAGFPFRPGLVIVRGLANVGGGGVGKRRSRVQAHMQIQGIDGIKALAFDVQGTCVDFYHPVLRAGAAANRDKGLTTDWAPLLAEWRELYRAALDAVIAGKRPWLRVDQIYREALDILLERHGLGGVFSLGERDELNGIWTRLDAWPDAI